MVQFLHWFEVSIGKKRQVNTYLHTTPDKYISWDFRVNFGGFHNCLLLNNAVQRQRRARAAMGTANRKKIIMFDIIFLVN